jgi:hypothetical protein
MGEIRQSVRTQMNADFLRFFRVRRSLASHKLAVTHLPLQGGRAQDRDEGLPLDTS